MGILKFVADPQTRAGRDHVLDDGQHCGRDHAGRVHRAAAMAVAAIVLLRMRWRVNLLSLGDGEARTLGVNIRMVRGVMVLCSTVLTACAVCISGTIGWVGLVVPHLSRMLTGPPTIRRPCPSRSSWAPRSWWRWIRCAHAHRSRAAVEHCHRLHRRAAVCPGC